MKNFVIVTLLALGINSLGCAPKGYIRADGIAGVVSAVCGRHDAYVRADASYTSEDKRASDLSSSELLRLAVSEAQKAEQK